MLNLLDVRPKPKTAPLVTRTHLILAGIVLAGFSLRLWGIARPVLHQWDERYHALVSKNIALHSWVPLFYADPVLEYDPANWQGNHVWLHKPPLGLWLGGLSMKIFGVSEWAHRVPSLVLGVLSILLTYGIARRLFDENVGLLAALFHSLSGHLLIFNSGTYGMDNVDNALFFFTELSVYGWLVFLEGRRTVFVLLSGIALGLGLLSKSYPALIAWGLFASLAVFPKYRGRAHAQHCLLILAAGLAVALPWRFYAQKRWPAEFAATESLVFGHFTQSQMTGEATNFFYHFANIPRDYGEMAVFALPLLFFFLVRERTEKFWIPALWFALPYGIFSFARTKISTLVNYCAPAVFIALALAAVWLWERGRDPDARRRIWFLAALTLGALLTLRVTGEKLIQIGTGLFALPKGPVLETLEKIKEPKAVLFNQPHYVETMFYGDVVAYPFLPDEKQVRRALAKGYNIYVLRDGSDGYKNWRSQTGSRFKDKIRALNPALFPERSRFLARLRQISLESVSKP